MTSPREEPPCVGDRAPERRLTVTGHWKRLLMGSPRPPVIVLIKFEDRAAHAIPISLVSSEVYSLVWVWEMGPPRLHLLLLFS